MNEALGTVASFSFNAGSPATLYTATTGAFIVAGPLASTRVYSDGTPSDTEFDTAEALTVAVSGTLPTPASFLGSLPFNGGLLPVFQEGSNVFVYGADVSGVYANTGSFFLNTANFTVCFGPATRISTPEGLRAVEDLRIGDLVLTHSGAAVSVKWLGRQTVATAFGPAERLRPVRFEAGALGKGLPLRDMVVTADHALLLDGVLVEARALVGLPGIGRVPVAELGDRYTVYHVETEGHEVILAEGTPAETFIDYVGRRAFDNYAEYVTLYGDERPLVELLHARVTSPKALPLALRRRLGIEAAA